MLSFDAALKGLAALVALTFALILLSAGSRRSTDRWLALFFLLIAGNHAAETARALAGDAEAQFHWFQLATVFAALDPVALYLFAAPERLRRPAHLAPLVAGGVLLAAWGLLLPSQPREVAPLPAALGAYTFVVYGVLLAHFVKALVERPADPVPRSLVPAMMVVAFHVTMARGEDLAAVAMQLVQGRETHDAWTAMVVAGTAVLGLLVLLFVLLAGRAPPAARPVLLQGVALAAGVMVLIRSYNLLVLSGEAVGFRVDVSISAVGRGGAAIRWLLFGAFVSMAVLRHDALGMSLAARRRAARILAALAFLTVGALLFGAARLLLPGAATGVRPTDLVLVAAAILLSQGFRSLLDWVALRVYGVPRPADAAGRHETYRLAALQAAHDDSQDARARLQRLRGELGIDAASAAVLEQIAHESTGGPLAEGQRFAGRYRVGHLLGRGGMARAFLAHDERLDRAVVLKEILPGVHAEEGLALREARLAGAIQHPNVLIVHDAIERKDRAVLVTEHAAGGSLAHRIEKGPPLSTGEGLRILRETLAGLAAVHAKGIVHRDLKPENLLLGEDGRVKIADFGIARARPGETRVSGVLLGTPAFMAPEQRRGEPTTPATDVHAVGLLGRRLLGDPAPPGLEAVLRRALADDPAQRWPSAQAMLDALAGAAPRQDQ